MDWESYSSSLVLASPMIRTFCLPATNIISGTYSILPLSVEYAAYVAGLVTYLLGFLGRSTPLAL